jgi:hypothetical protein
MNKTFEVKKILRKKNRFNKINVLLRNINFALDVEYSPQNNVLFISFYSAVNTSQSKNNTFYQ